MAWEELRALNLSAEQVRTAAKFHEACAQTALAEFEAISRRTPVSGPENLNDIQFALRANAASALREAAQWRLLLSPSSALPDLGQAGSLFQQLGQPFGYYLKSMAGTLDERDQNRIDLLMRAMVAELTDERPDHPEIPAASEIRVRHQQQAYLIVTASSLDSGSAQRLSRLAAIRSPHRDGVIPVGSLGTPIAKYWSIARHLLGDGEEDALAIANLLHSMCRAYGETMALAQSNKHLWKNASAPVDVADLDISGLTAFSVRRFGLAMMEDVLADAGPLDQLARIPLNLGLSLARPNPNDLE
ncbi:MULTISPECIES: hypothetical protein [Amycolatopsis]|uniref:hypothetical protein n=1 Tax=Amycolatopsis sp. cg13 TaxID=3238807 RepID=UPI0035264E3E